MSLINAIQIDREVLVIKGNMNCHIILSKLFGGRKVGRRGPKSAHARPLSAKFLTCPHQARSLQDAASFGPGQGFKESECRRLVEFNIRFAGVESSRCSHSEISPRGHTRS